MAFLSRARELGCAIRIVSHKTRYPAEGEADLHKAALTFMEANGLFDPQGGGLSPEHVHFEPTRATKAERIKAIGCTHFIDDLPEMLTHPGFPPGVKRYLFSPSGGSALPGIVHIAGFAQLSELLFAAEGT